MGKNQQPTDFANLEDIDLIGDQPYLIPLGTIDFPDHHDPLDMRSIKREGQLQPILVCECDDERWLLIAGRHRLEARCRLEESHIEARVIADLIEE